jgi:hypothetical protein
MGWLPASAVTVFLVVLLVLLVVVVVVVVVIVTMVRDAVVVMVAPVEGVGPRRREHDGSSPDDDRIDVGRLSDDDGLRLIDRNVDDLGVGGDDLDRLLLPHHDYLLVGVEVARGFDPQAESLDRVVDILFLGIQGVAQPAGPADVVAHLLEHFGKGEECDHARVPSRILGWLRGTLVLGEKPRRFDDV